MTVKDEFSGCDTNKRLDGKVVLVTGATAGTGLKVAENLSKRGAKIIIASRNPGKLENAKKIISQSSGNANVVTRVMDFENLSSIRDFVNITLATESRLDVLINNIGAVGLEDRLTSDNLQLMMQVNYFGTFLLTYLLFPLLRASAPSRIINVTSLALILGNIELDHMNELGRYSNFGFYCNAKLAEVLFTVEMNKRINGSGVSIYSMDPGLGMSDFFRNLDQGILKTVLRKGLYTFGRPLHRVATMPVYLAVDDKVGNLSGKHFRYCAEFPSSLFVNDAVLTHDLFELSKKLLNIRDSEVWEKWQ